MSAVVVEAPNQVRIAGWLMFDPQHPDHVGKYRQTLWEIHPIDETMDSVLSCNRLNLDQGSVDDQKRRVGRSLKFDESGMMRPQDRSPTSRTCAEPGYRSASRCTRLAAMF